MASWHHNGRPGRRQVNWALVHWAAAMFSAYWLVFDGTLLITAAALFSFTANIICFVRELDQPA